jgi:hypothetical protein
MGTDPKAGLDEAMLRTMAALVRQPPKPHEAMKVGRVRRLPEAGASAKKPQKAVKPQKAPKRGK